jgi:hypothetical protein
VHKHDIAVEYIEVAIDLFEQGKFCSSLHLAGAAEQIFHDTLVDRNMAPTKKTRARLAKQLGSAVFKCDIAQTKIEKTMDHAKNAIKHVSTDKSKAFVYEVDFDARSEAFLMIRRSITNASLCNVFIGLKMSGFMARIEPPSNK